MGRKVIQIADSTQLISLPRKWAQLHNISKGDELEVKEEGNRLVVSTEKGIGLGRVEVDVTDLDRDSIMFFIRALYKNGYDEIKVNFRKTHCENFRTHDKELIANVVVKEVSRLNGIEVFSQREDYCVIKSISEDTSKAFDTMLRRIFLLVSETIGDLIEGYENGNTALLSTIQSKHDTVTKFLTYCQRLLNKLGYENYKKTALMYHILEVIDIMLDFVKYNARALLETKIHASVETTAVCRDIHKSFDGFYDLYYSFSSKKVYELNRVRCETRVKLVELQKKLRREELRILSNMEQFFEYTLNLTNARIALEY